MTIEKITNYLKENGDVALSVAREIFYWNGDCDFVDVFDLEELCGITDDTYELVRAVIYGDVHNLGMVRYNVYGNLESVDDYDLENDAVEYISDYIDEMIDLYDNSHIVIEDLELMIMIDEYLDECYK